jgi:hypothetical protein
MFTTDDDSPVKTLAGNSAGGTGLEDVCRRSTLSQTLESVLQFVVVANVAALGGNDR